MNISASRGPTLRGKIIAAACICAALVLCFAVLVAIDRRPRTHDGRVFAYSAAMASEINGRVVRILVRNDERVSKGARLIQIDPVPYEMQLRQARAQVAALKAQIALTGRQVTSQGSGAQAAENITAWALAINQRLNIEAFAGVIVPYPTYAEVGKRAAMTYFTRGLTSPQLRRIIGWLRRFG